MNTPRVTITKNTTNGRPSPWQVRYHDDGKVRRSFFTSQASAEAFASKVRGDSISVREFFATLPVLDLERLKQAYEEAQRRGVDFLAAVTDRNAPAKTTSPTLATVIAELILSRKKLARAHRYTRELKRYLDKFADGRTSLPIADVTFAQVEAFIDGYELRSRPTIRARLSTLFAFAVRRAYRPDNPCDRIEPPTLDHITPEILTVEETQKALKWLAAKPRSLAWFALSAFAGLRPEEAEATRWDQINFAEGHITVAAQTSKIRQRRVVYPLPTAMDWLRRAKKLKSQLPLTIKTRKADRDQLRAVLGWKKWKQDVTRHTAASMWLASEGSAAKVATALGHSEAILRKNYMALVTQEQAKAFWALRPQ